ncbi:MAG: preprotein translocase subunit TatB [Desulfobacteraceae bacterium]|nr:preprotein translocase subunit TatB [Desulfobacteraceae bacterium]
MSTTIDTRGLSCPQPVLMTMDEIKKGNTNEIIVMVDSEASRENVSRAATNQGCRVRKISRDGEEYKIDIVRD